MTYFCFPFSDYQLIINENKFGFLTRIISNFVFARTLSRPTFYGSKVNELYNGPCFQNKCIKTKESFY